MPDSILLINPWIHDFAAFDLWAKPLGLLYLSARLKRAGFKVRLVDCLDRLHPESRARPPRAAWPPGTGQWARKIIPTPEPLADIPRYFAQYGLPEEVFCREVALGDPPAAVMVTSMMTYWYTGLQRTIALVREIRPETPIILGGIYPSLCPEHAAAKSGADLTLANSDRSGRTAAFKDILGLDYDLIDSRESFCQDRPDLDLYSRLEFAPLMISRGCPYNCPYCASARLFQGFVQRKPDEILAEIEDRLNRLHLEHFTFYDDALLVNAEDLLLVVLEEVIRREWKLNFHCPNGLHVRLITPEAAGLMFRSGFQTIRLGLETLDPVRNAALGGKVPSGHFETAFRRLITAGFTPSQIGVYVLCGLPGQSLAEVRATVQAVKALGGRPYLSEYSPLPDTELWPAAVEHSSFDLAADPLFHNNTFFPCRGPDFTWERFQALKREAAAQRR